MDIEEIWNKFEKKFEIDEEIDFFTLSSLLRVIIEKEKLKGKIEALDYSIIHKFLHWESIRTDKSMYLISIINILENFPEKYNCRNIKKQITENIPKEYDFWEIFNYEEMVGKSYELKITNYHFFSYRRKIFFYTGEIMEKEIDRKITFISTNKFTLGDIYNFSFQYVNINYDVKIFMEIKSENLSSIIKEKIHVKYSISNYNELLLLLNSKKWPLPFKLEKERELLRDIYHYLTTIYQHDTKYFYPFLLNPYINKMSLKKKDIDKIINSYNMNEENEMKNLKKEWKIEEGWKTNMERENWHYLEVDKYTYENFNWNSNDFIKENNEEIFSIHHKKTKEVYEIFLKLFKNNGENTERMIGKKNITESDLNGWEWKSEDEGKTPKRIINLLKSKGLLILLGPAGHGKTFSLNEIIDFYLCKKLTVKLICPTWKSISLYKNKIESSTVKKRNLNLLDNFFDDIDLLIIDEISLIGEWTFLSKIESKTQIIFSGDINQLGPLDKTTNFREHEWLLKIATEKRIINLKDGKNYRISNLSNNHIGKQILKSFIDEKFDFKNNVKNIHFFYSPVEVIEKLKKLSTENYTIITQFNGGMWGVDFLNRLLRKGYSEKFEKGDKIIFIKTQIIFKGTDNSQKFPDYYNGLCGEIIDIQSLNFSSKKYNIKTDQGKQIEIEIEDDKITNTIQRSYVINAHKAQGSTIENVVVLSQSRVGYDWLYTAASRFSRNIEIIFIASSSKDMEFLKKTQNSIF